MSSLKETIAEVISQHIALEDTYTYELTRTKSAFEVGTMSLEDFEEWTEENVADLAKAIVGVLQPQLNENQQIVLEWLKAYSERSTFSAMYPIFQLGDYDRRVLEGPRQIDRAFSELNFRQESQVLQAYSQWALEQEEE